MSIVRVGLGETKKFAEGYDAIFGKKKPQAKKTRSSSAGTGKKKASKKK